MTLNRTGLFGNLKNFNFLLLLLPLHPGTHQYCVQFIMDLHKIRYALNTVIKIIQINRTSSSRKLYDHMILEWQLLLNTIFIKMIRWHSLTLLTLTAEYTKKHESRNLKAQYTTNHTPSSHNILVINTSHAVFISIYTHPVFTVFAQGTQKGWTKQKMYKWATKQL